MGAEAAIYSLLTADSDVSALVGTRVGPEPMTDATLAILPFITHERIGTPVTARSRSGVIGYRQSTHEINNWAASPAAAKTLADHARDALNGKNQVTAGGTWVQEIYLEDESAAHEERTAGRENRAWVVEQTYSIWCSE